MKTFTHAAGLLAIVSACYAGYALSPASHVAAQRATAPQAQTADPNLANGQHQPPEFKSTIPAPSLRQSTPLWPNQPAQAMYWSIDDIHKAHETLAAAEKAGRTIDPNSTLHDFPYWTRTHSYFITHVAEHAAGDTAAAHAGYDQFVVIMGGSGTVVAGGRIVNPVALTESGGPIPGETRGAAIEGGETFTVKDGDWISIPAGSPAQFRADAAGGMTCMVMKINAMLYPWDLIR